MLFRNYRTCETIVCDYGKWCSSHKQDRVKSFAGPLTGVHNFDMSLTLKLVNNNQDSTKEGSLLRCSFHLLQLLHDECLDRATPVRQSWYALINGMVYIRWLMLRCGKQHDECLDRARPCWWLWTQNTTHWLTPMPWLFPAPVCHGKAINRGT